MTTILLLEKLQSASHAKDRVAIQRFKDNKAARNTGHDDATSTNLQKIAKRKHAD